MSFICSIIHLIWAGMATKQATSLAFLRVLIIWSVDISVKRLSCVNKTIPAGQVFVRYWHSEQRPHRSYILPLCQSYPGTTAYLIWAAERSGGEEWLAASRTHAPLCSVTTTHPAYSNASNGTNSEQRTSGSKFSAKLYVKEPSAGLPRKLMWTVERCNDNRTLTIQ